MLLDFNKDIAPLFDATSVDCMSNPDVRPVGTARFNLLVEAQVRADAPVFTPDGRPRNITLRSAELVLRDLAVGPAQGGMPATGGEWNREQLREFALWLDWVNGVELGDIDPAKVLEPSHPNFASVGYDDATILTPYPPGKINRTRASLILLEVAMGNALDDAGNHRPGMPKIGTEWDRGKIRKFAYWMKQENII